MILHLTPTTDLILSITLALGALGAGLSALNLHLLSILKLQALSLVFKYACGVAGLIGAALIATNYEALRNNSDLGIAVCVILVVVNIGIGLSALGTNLARTFHVEFLQKSLQLIAGVAGAYSLVVIYRTMN